MPRAAERQLKAAESLEPASLQLERQQARVALDLQEWRQMDLLADDVVARSPRDLNTQRPARAREIHHLSELRLSVGKGLHSDNPVSGTHDLSFETAIYSPPLADSWRLFGGHRFAEGNFEEGKAAVASCLPVLNGVRATTGASLSSPASIFTARTSPASAFPPPMTLAIAGSWAANWSGFRSRRRCARYATASAPTAAKAGCAGLQTNAGSTASARPPAGLPIATAAEYTLSGKERLWQTPWLTLDLQPGLSASANSRTDTAYYSPARDLAATAALAVDHTLYQRYDTVWSQQLLAGGGSYWQKSRRRGDHGAGLRAAPALEQRRRHRADAELG